jgi:filamentous hemagglutinin family protein
MINAKQTLVYTGLPLLFAFHVCAPAVAQLIPDRTLPQNSRVNGVGNLQRIEGGTTSGPNLFHSFQTFSVPDGVTASFQNAPTVQTIITRVTGNSLSQIDGTLAAQGNANLFLLNPNGIIFGENATLRIGGSFFGTTADSIQFPGGQSYDAVNPQAPPLLTMSAPVGVQFGAQPGAIQVKGPGNQLFVDFPFVVEDFRPDGLQVSPGQTLALLGGGLSLQGGNITARDGRVELASVTGPAAVTLQSTATGWRFNYGAVNQFGPIDLTQAASVNTSGNGSGFIHLQGEQIRILAGSTLLARPLGNGQGGGITVQASDLLLVNGFSQDNVGPAFPSSLLTDVAVFATGQGGNIKIVAPSLRIADGGFISAGTFDEGDAGSLQVNANTIELSGDGPFGSSGLFADTYGPGRGGQITINADRLRIQNGAQISTSTLAGSPLGSGPAGNMTLTVNTIELLGGAPTVGSSGLFSVVETDQPGGTIVVNSDRLFIADGARIATSTFDRGKAGNIQVESGKMVFSGTSPGGAAGGVFSTVEPGANGNGGQVTLNAQQIQVDSGAQVLSSTFGDGDAGSLTLRAETVSLDGLQTPAGGTTSVAAAVDSGGAGSGGQLSITANRLQVVNGAQVIAGTKGTGDAQDLRVNAQVVELSGGDRFGQSGLFVSALESTGDSGNLTVTADQVTLRDGATLNASNFSSGGLTPSGQGSAGNIQVDAQQIELAGQSSITVATVQGDRGNITLNAPLVRLRENSLITANATGPATGGNITLDTEFLVASENSDITANAEQSFGGRVTINATGLFGTVFRPELTPQSDITASSALGPTFNGIVEINTPETDPSKTVATLSEAPTDVNQQVRSACGQSAGNRLVVTGQGGLPEQTIHALRAPQVTVSPAQGRTSPVEIVSAPLHAIHEAQGWVRNADGHLQLVGGRSSMTSVQTASRCDPRRSS